MKFAQPMEFCPFLVRSLYDLPGFVQLGLRCASSAFNMDRSTARYQSRRADYTNLRDAMKSTARS